jgi:hypothetical protein
MSNPSSAGAATIGGCSAGTVRIGAVTASPGAASLGTDLWFATVRIRAATRSCKLLLPHRIAVGSGHGEFHDVSIATPVPKSIILTEARWSKLVFGDSWRLPTAEPSVHDYCRRTFSEVSVLRVPIGNGHVTLSTGHTWAAVCQTPATLGPTLQTK